MLSVELHVNPNKPNCTPFPPCSQQLLLMQQQQYVGRYVGGGRPVDPRLLVDGSGHMPFHYATGQHGLSTLLHPRSNLSTFALMPAKVKTNKSLSRLATSGSRSFSSDSGASPTKGGTSSPSPLATVTVAVALKEQLWAQLSMARGDPRHAHWGTHGSSSRGVSLSGTSLGEEPTDISGVTATLHCEEAGHPAGELNSSGRLKTLQQADALAGSLMRYQRGVSNPGSLAATSSSMVLDGDTIHTWRCELLPCQHRMCGGCAEQLFECQENDASICCPMCHTPVRELRPAA